MPQLNPAPWFMVFMLVWMTLIMFFTKIIKIYPHHLSTMQHKKQPNNFYWTWPWP